MSNKLPVPPPRLGRGVKRYNPTEGLKTIAVAEAAEKHFARAKDLAQLTKAIEKKLEAQADYVRWWDGLGEKRGSGPSKKKPGQKSKQKT